MGQSGYGTTFSGATTGAIGEITRVGLPGISVDEIDVTTMDSTEAWKEFIAGLKDAGEASLTLLYEKANTATLMGAVGAANEVWTITLPDGSTFACSGFIKSLGGESPQEDKISQTATVRFSGEPTFTPGT